jgi:hypothetical protein
MPEETADIIASVGVKFSVNVSSGSIRDAKIGDTELTLGADSKSFTIDSAAAGDTSVDLTMIFAHGEPNAVISVGTVFSGTAKSAPAPGTLRNTEVDGTVLIFGGPGA